jgi:exosome complex component RRP41
MSDMVVACTAGYTSSAIAPANPPNPSSLPGLSSGIEQVDDPLLDLSLLEENELPFLTVATVGSSTKVATCVCETRMDVGRLESMLKVGVDGCKAMKNILEGVVREHGKRVNQGGKTMEHD